MHPLLIHLSSNTPILIILHKLPYISIYLYLYMNIYYTLLHQYTLSLFLSLDRLVKVSTMHQSLYYTSDLSHLLLSLWARLWVGCSLGWENNIKIASRVATLRLERHTPLPFAPIKLCALRQVLFCP